MKISLFFESPEEFARFVNSASFLDFNPGFTMDVAHFKETRMILPMNAYWPLLSHVCEVRVGDIVYTVKEDSQESQRVDCVVANYMLNTAQMENDSIWMHADDGVRVLGAKRVFEQVKKLPDSFLLREGWCTDHRSYVFRKSTGGPHAP